MISTPMIIYTSKPERGRKKHLNLHETDTQETHGSPIQFGPLIHPTPSRLPFEQTLIIFIESTYNRGCCFRWRWTMANSSALVAMSHNHRQSTTSGAETATTSCSCTINYP